MLLRVVGSRYTKFGTGQTFEPTTPNISFVPWSSKHSATIFGLQPRDKAAMLVAC